MYYAVIAKEYDVEDVDHLIGIFESEEKANAVKRQFDDEWEKRYGGNCYSFIILSVPELNVQYVRDTYQIMRRLDKNTGKWVNTPPENEE